MIHQVMQQLAIFLKKEIIIDNQLSKLPACPYGAYKIISIDKENPHQRIRQHKSALNNEVEVKNYYKRTYNVELNYYNYGKTASSQIELYDLAEKSWLWMQEDGRDYCKSLGSIIRVKTKQLLSEVKQVENSNNYQVGFKFSLTAVQDSSKKVEAITGVDYTATIKK